MDPEIKAWLYDMLNAIAEIESFFADRPMQFANYQVDLRTKRAVERNLEIIGEAMNRIVKKDRSPKTSIHKNVVRECNSVRQPLRYSLNGAARRYYCNPEIATPRLFVSNIAFEIAWE